MTHAVTLPNRPRAVAARRIALLDPLGDAGIGGYTHELAAALTRKACDVEVFAPTLAFAALLPRPYSLRAAFDGLTFSIDGALHEVRPRIETCTASGQPALAAYLRVLGTRVYPMVPPRPTAIAPKPRQVFDPPASVSDGPLRPERRRAAHQLASKFRSRGFDTVWAQWAVLPRALSDLFRCAPYDGLAMVHTVHNVLPHEANPAEAGRLRELYAHADALVVHSRQAAAMLERLRAGPQRAIVESRHGTYTIYPRRPEMRACVRSLLGVPDSGTLLLCFGAVRPYKNTEALVRALALLPGLPLTLVVAGWEYGFPDSVPGDKLGRIRALAYEYGVSDRVRLLPGPFGIEQTAELFEAADVVPLPYHESSGSGLLAMALTYGRRVLCTPVGGMAEYLTRVEDGLVVRAADPATLAVALRAIAMPRAATSPSMIAPATLHWDAITAALLPDLRSRGQYRAAAGR